jgi:hypothetical protein
VDALGLLTVTSAGRDRSNRAPFGDEPDFNETEAVALRAPPAIKEASIKMEVDAASDAQPEPLPTKSYAHLVARARRFLDLGDTASARALLGFAARAGDVDARAGLEMLDQLCPPADLGSCHILQETAYGLRRSSSRSSKDEPVKTPQAQRRPAPAIKATATTPRLAPRPHPSFPDRVVNLAH